MLGHDHLLHSIAAEILNICPLLLKTKKIKVYFFLMVIEFRRNLQKA